MSRCFPFPPPGYEKKSRPDIANVLKKEKTKEKKHKDKKDKEKREGKDKRDKERRDGKHREKKDKKEKHKDKKKEKDREKDQEKGSDLVEKRLSEQSEDYIAGKLYQREKERGKEQKEKSSIPEDKRQFGQFESCNGEKLHQKVEKSRDTKNTSDEKKLAVQLQGHSRGATPVQNSLLDKDSEDSKFLQDFSKRISNETKGSGSQLVEGFLGNDYRKDERIDNFAIRDIYMAVDGKEKIKDIRVDNWKMDGQRIQHGEKFNGNAISHNLPGIIQNKLGVFKPMERSEGRMEGNEKPKERELDDKRGDKRKSKHKDKKSQANDKKSDKEKKKEDKEKREHKKSEKDTTKSSDNSDAFGTLNNKTSHLRDSDMNAATEGNLRKRKDIEKNGFVHDYVVRPEKLLKLNAHLLSENGKELEPFEPTTLFTPQRQMTVNNFEVDNKDHKINGLTGAHQLPIAAPERSPMIAEQIDESSRKSPHPDVKYLSKVLTVPEMDEWPDFDDQAWLFNSKESLLNKAEADPVGVNQGQEVWAEALMIESADMFALPYVIPY